MARIARIVSTTAFKLSAIYLAVFTIFAIVFAGSITYAANRLLNQQIHDGIESELLDLADVWNNNGGYLALLEAIDDRSRRPGASLYMLANNFTGEILIGNVRQVSTEQLADAARAPTEIRYLTPEGDDAIALARVVQLPNDLLLLVGRDLAERQQFATLITSALVAAAVLLIGLAAVSWFFVSRRVLKRIDSVSATTRQIMAGDLSGRLEVTGTNDEFDRLAASLNDMLARIEMLLQGLQDVSNNIAHDLKTPLTRMRNRIEGVLAQPDDSARQRETLQATIDDADQLITTFNALLTIARLEAGTGDGSVDEIDAVAIARDVLELYEPVAEEAGVELQLTGVETAILRGNRELLGQALANLIDNAIKHGRPGADSGRSPQVVIDVAQDADNIAIRVTDNGPGIPEAERRNVLGRFVRLERSRSTPGTGLGLSLAAAAAKRANGTLELSDAAPGLTATLRLPAQ